MIVITQNIDELHKRAGSENILELHGLHDTVKPVLSSHSKIDKAKTLMTKGSLMKVKSIAECSTAILSTCIKR